MGSDLEVQAFVELRKSARLADLVALTRQVVFAATGTHRTPYGEREPGQELSVDSSDVEVKAKELPALDPGQLPATLVDHPVVPVADQHQVGKVRLLPRPDLWRLSGV